MKERPGSQQKKSDPGAIFAVRIQPRASKNGVSRMDDGSLKIRLTAPPVDGAANEALVKFLSETLDLSKSSVEIVTGHTSREKRVKISGMSDEDVNRLLNTAGQ